MLMSLITALQDPALYDHPVGRFEVVETHISRVLLTGDTVYKIKKPVNFGFLDFSTLDKRRHYCEEELRLNQRLAPELYLGVVAITGSETSPQINGDGDVIEYAVKMRQFDQAAQFNRLLAEGKLDSVMIDRLADKVAQFHLSLPAVDNNYGDINHVRQPMLDNIQQVRNSIDDAGISQRLDALEQWTQQQLQELASAIESRKQQGYVRECHGDMHLRNIALWQDDILLFDCIEFNENLYRIDVMSDIAFLVMDLEDRGQAVLAARFLNRYLEITGDYEGLPLFTLYKVYRAMVRAKVDALRTQQELPASDEYRQTFEDFQQYLQLAERYIQPGQPRLLVNYGLSGSGKTTVSRLLAERLPAIQVRSDVERKRLFHVPLTGTPDAAVQQVLYTAKATEKTYHRLLAIARCLLNAGYTVIMDAANLSQRHRQRFYALAESLTVPWRLLVFEADEALLRQRLIARAQQGDDASDATVAVLQHQLESDEPPSAAELSFTVRIDTSDTVDVEAIIKQLC